MKIYDLPGARARKKKERITAEIFHFRSIGSGSPVFFSILTPKNSTNSRPEIEFRQTESKTFDKI